MNPIARLCRGALKILLPPEHRAVVLAHLDAEPSTWQLVASLPGAFRLRLRSARHGLWDDARHGVRLIRRHPGFALAVTLTLALGVAATNAVTTVAYAVFLRPLPFADADRIVSIEEIDRSHDDTSGNVSWPDLLDYQSKNTSLESIAGHTGGNQTIQIDGAEATRVPVALVTGRFFDLLGVRPLLGRLIEDPDVVEGAAVPIVLSYSSWRTRFGADPAVIGRIITMNAARAPVVGVLPPDFEFPPQGEAEFWLPVRPSTAQRERKFFHWMDAVGRLRAGVNVRQAEADLDAVARGFAVQDPKYHATSGVRAVRLRDRLVREARPVVLVLSLAGTLVFIVASTNVAGLLLSRGAMRRVEMDIRDALGAARGRLARQLIVENLVLALPGIALGLLAGYWTVQGFVTAIPRATRLSLPHLGALTLDLDAMALSLAGVWFVVIVCSLVPALRTSGDVRLSGRRLIGRRTRLQWVLVGAQVALAVTLLSGAGLMVQSLRRLLDVSPGFQTQGLQTFTVSLSGPRYQSATSVDQFFRDVTTNLQAVPGVEGVTSIDRLPLTGSGYSGAFTIAGVADVGEQSVLVRTVAANYFTVIGIALEQGRGFSASDASSSPQVVMVNRRLADSSFGGDPIGRRITFPWAPGPLTIVGVVGDERFEAVDQPIQPVVYFPDSQSSSRSRSLVVRSAMASSAIVPLIRARVAEIDAALPVFAVATMDDIAGASEAVFRRRAVMTLLVVFASAAVLLAAIGVYGVLAQLVAERTREIGLRLALGAGATGVASAVLGRGLLAAAIGVCVGLPGSVLLGRALGALLFGTTPLDPAAMTAVVAVIVLAVTIAALLPTRRALRIDPMEALRREG